MVPDKTNARSLVALAVVLLMCAACAEPSHDRSSSKSRVATTAEFATLTVNAEFLGHLLYDTYLEASGQSSDSDTTAIQTAHAMIKNRCSWPYKFVVIPASRIPFPVQQIPLLGRDSTIVYALADAGNDDLALGRHYRVELGSNGKDARSMVVSTEDCAIVSKDELLRASAIESALSPGPTEFHVFLSLLHHTRLQIRTAAGLWNVDNGKVDFVRADPSYQPRSAPLINCAMLGGWNMTTTEAACRGTGGTVLQ